MYMNEIKRENCRCMNTFTKSRLSRQDEVHTDRMLKQPKVDRSPAPTPCPLRPIVSPGLRANN